LHEPREHWEQVRQCWAGHELRDPTTAAGLTVQRTSVVALDHPDVGIVEQRRQQTSDEMGAEVADVGIDPAQEVSLGYVERLPQRVALPTPRWQMRQDLVGGEDVRVFCAG